MPHVHRRDIIKEESIGEIMIKKIVRTDKAPLPIGPYNQAVIIDHFVFTSGQIPLDLQNNVVAGGVAEQARCVLENLKAVLEAAGSSLNEVVKCTVFLKNMGDFAAMNAVYGEYFKAENAPARSTIEVARLPKDVLVEIEAVAHTGS
jgi:2-iminobutanoate/2-iminopropanoate deaminase